MKRITRYIVISSILSVFIPTSVCSQNNSRSEESATAGESVETTYGALAIDRADGIYYGWAIDQPSLAEAEKKAIEECKKKGGKCTIVLSFSGAGCAAYRHISGNVGMGYGWGLAPTEKEADAKAKEECAERSYSLPAPNYSCKCSSKNAGELIVIYDAHDELKLIQPGMITDY